MRISPFSNAQHAQTATTSSSKSLSPDQDEYNIQVAELLPKRHRKRRASLIKLTDECLAAINEAIHKEWRIRITVVKENILIHVGNGTATPTIFQCSQQTLPGTTDAIYREPSASNTYQTISSLNTKLVVNATEKTFEETREKTQKLAEEEAKKMVKDVMVKKDPMAKYRTNKGPMFKPTSTSFTPSTTNLKTNGFTPSTNAQKRVSPPISSTTRTVSPSTLLKSGANTTTNSKATPQPLTVQNRHELLKRSIKERCLHLLSTCKFKTNVELLDRLRFEGAPKNERAEDFLHNAETIIKEISQFDNSLDALFVNPKFHTEINLRWPWLLSSEREQLRRLIKPLQSTTEESTSIAPMRRSGISAPVAPSSSTNNSTKQNDKPLPQVNTPSNKSSKDQSNKKQDQSNKNQDQPNKQQIKSPIKQSPNGISIRVPSRQEKPKRSPMISTLSSATESPTGRKRHVHSPDFPDQVEVKRPRVQSFNGKLEVKSSTPVSSGTYLEPMDTSDGGRRRISNASDIGRPVKSTPIKSTPVKSTPIKSTLKVENKPSPTSLNELMEVGRRRISNASDIGRPIRPSLNGKTEKQALNGKTEKQASNGKTEKQASNGKHIDPMDTHTKRRSSNASDISNIGNTLKPIKSWHSVNDLEKQFPAVCDSKQARHYHELFESDYPIYRKCHEELTRVSKKFNTLKIQFDRLEPGSIEQSEVLRTIQETYDHYQNNKRYSETRHRHTKLHSKLSLLKQRVSDWEKRLTNGSSHPQSTRIDLSPMAQPRLNIRYRRERSASPGGSTTYSSNSAASTTSVESLGSVSHLYD